VAELLTHRSGCAAKRMNHIQGSQFGSTLRLFGCSGLEVYLL